MFGESDQLVGEKVGFALQSGLKVGSKVVFGRFFNLIHNTGCGKNTFLRVFEND